MRRLATLAVLTMLIPACGDDGDHRAETGRTATSTITPAPRESGTSLVARATGPRITAVDAPGSDVEVATLPNPRPIAEGAEVELVLLVKEERDGWLQVYLPVRPNGTTGWIREADVDLVGVAHKIVVNLATFQLELFERDELVLETRVGLGRDGEPTPPGTYFITELLQPPDPDGVYGPYAYGLSGFSDVHFDFGGGPGQIGLHGTNDPSSIGGPASAGCIRLPNDVITELARTLPLGTPVEIVA